MRLRRVIVILCLGLILTTTAAVIIGRVQPVPEGLAMLHLDICAPPCWIEIRPGVTTFAGSQKRIRELFPASDYYISGTLTDYTIQSLHDKTLIFSASLQTDDNLLIKNMALPGNQGGQAEMPKIAASCCGLSKSPPCNPGRAKNIYLTFDHIWLANDGVYYDKSLLRVGDLNTIWASPSAVGIVSPCDGVWSLQYNLAVNTTFEARAVPSGSNSIINWDNPVETMLMSSDEASIYPLPSQQWHGFLALRQYDDNNALAKCQP